MASLNFSVIAKHLIPKSILNMSTKLSASRPILLMCFVLSLCLSPDEFAIAENNNHSHRHAAANPASNSPRWNLRTVSSGAVSSQRFAGRPYVLVLHLGKGCLHCAQQLQVFGNRIHSFDAAGLEVVAVSTDHLHQLSNQLDEFGDEFAIRHLASDNELSLFRQVGAFDRESEKPLHGTLLVDASGRIRWSEIGEHPFMDVDTLLSEARLVSSGATTIQEDDSPQRPKVFLNKPPLCCRLSIKATQQ